MAKEKYTLINLFGQSRLDIEVEDQLEACTTAMYLFFDRDKEWDAEEKTSADGMEFVNLSGTNKETGKKLYIIVAKTEEVEKNEVFDHLEIFN